MQTRPDLRWVGSLTWYECKVETASSLQSMLQSVDPWLADKTEMDGSAGTTWTGLDGLWLVSTIDIHQSRQAGLWRWCTLTLLPVVALNTTLARLGSLTVAQWPAVCSCYAHCLLSLFCTIQTRTPELVNRC